MDLYSGMDLQLTIGEALGTDYFGLREPFTPQQEDYLTRTRGFVDTEVLPVINGYWERAEFPFDLVEKMADDADAVIALDGTTLDRKGLGEVRAALAAELPEELGGPS